MKKGEYIEFLGDRSVNAIAAHWYEMKKLGEINSKNGFSISINESMRTVVVSFVGFIIYFLPASGSTFLVKVPFLDFYNPAEDNIKSLKRKIACEWTECIKEAQAISNNSNIDGIYCTTYPDTQDIIINANMLVKPDYQEYKLKYYRDVVIIFVLPFVLTYLYERRGVGSNLLVEWQDGLYATHYASAVD
jgi:hypothetical protein